VVAFSYKRLYNKAMTTVAGIALIGYYTKWYLIATLFLLIVALTYILWVNPRYMNRALTKKL